MDPLESAVDLLRQQRFEEGIHALGPLTERSEYRYKALGYRAFHYKQFGRYEEALADYAAMQEMAAGDPMVDCYIAEIYRSLGKYHDAIQRAMKALEKAPELAQATHVIQSAQEALGHCYRSSAAPEELQCSAETKPLNPVIELLEKQPASFPASVFPEVGRLLYSFVRMARPKLVVETGTFVGYSALHIAQALEDNAMGHLHCFDIFAPLPGYSSPVAGATEDTFEVVTRHFEAAGLAHRATLHRGDSSAQIRSVFEGRPNTVDLAFIDGDHLLQGCMKDWLAVNELLAPGGVILLHDTEPKKCAWLGPRYLIDKLKENMPDRYGVINLPTVEGFGVALLQKYTETGQLPGWWPSLYELLTEHFHMANYPFMYSLPRFGAFGELWRKWRRP